jgi:hypothetical protein
MAVGLLILAIFALVGFLAYRGYLQAKKRREAFAVAAKSRGWTYAARDDRYANMFSGAPFGVGHDRRASNVLAGTHDSRPFVAYDYRYSTTEHYTDGQGHSATRTEHHNYSVIALTIGHVVPELSVSPEGFFSRAVGKLLNNDITFESEQFNRAFTVNSSDRKFATDVINPQMMEYLLTLPDLPWSFRQGHLITTEAGKHSLESLDATLLSIDGILDRVPAFVWGEPGGTGPTR